MATVSLKNVRKSYGNHETVHGVNLEIVDGDFTVLVGPSGCGKSTLLRMIAGLDEVTSGTITIDEVDVTHQLPSERGIAMVFQSYALYPHMSVYDNMAFGLKLEKASRETLRSRIEQAARILQLEPLLKRLPKELSGGQRQRVAIGRAIVRNPKVFLFDEPLSNLDAALRVQMRIELAKLHADLGTTMVYVTHDQVEAMTLADRIVVLNSGRIEQVGAPLELYHAPKNLFVASFIGSPKMNLLPAHLIRAAAGQWSVTPTQCNPIPFEGPVALAHKVPQQVTMGIRPEHVQFCAFEGAHAHGKIVVIEHLGNETFVHLDLGLPENRLLVVRTDANVRDAKGDVVALRFPAERLHLFDADGHRLPFIPTSQPTP